MKSDHPREKSSPQTPQHHSSPIYLHDCYCVEPGHLTWLPKIIAWKMQLLSTIAAIGHLKGMNPCEQKFRDVNSLKQPTSTKVTIGWSSSSGRILRNFCSDFIGTPREGGIGIDEAYGDFIQMVVKGKEIPPPPNPLNSGFRNYSNLPRSWEVLDSFSDWHQKSGKENPCHQPVHRLRLVYLLILVFEPSLGLV